jgi:hypothetical protein
MVSRFRSLSVACLLLLTASPLLAAEPQPAAVDQQAAAKFRSALQRFDAGEFADALPLFQEAYGASHSPNARLYIARCLVELGRDVEAHAEFSGVVADTTQNRDPRYDKTREAAQTELGVVALRVSKLVITLPDNPPGLAVSLDGEVVPNEQLGSSIVTKPGRHELSATATGMKDSSRRVDVAAGQSKTIMLALSPVATKEEPAATASSSPKSGGLGSVRTAGLVTAGVGVVALGVFAVTGSMAKSQYDSVKDACGGERCTDDKYGSDIDRGKSLQTVANVSLIVGGLALVAGGSLFLFGPRGDGDSAAAAYVLPGGGYATYRARF